jgi:hypothetical protein
MDTLQAASHVCKLVNKSRMEVIIWLHNRGACETAVLIKNAITFLARI